MCIVTGTVHGFFITAGRIAEGQVHGLAISHFGGVEMEDAEPLPTRKRSPRRDRESKQSSSLSMTFPSAAATRLSSTILEIPILYESDHLLVINKPSGISHHNSLAKKREGLITTTITTRDDVMDDDDYDDDDDNQINPGILSILRQQRTIEGERLYGVHRLDQVTSGILVLAKDLHTARRLTAAFREGRVIKYYTALSQHKATKRKQGWIQGEMKRGRRKSWFLTPATSHSSSRGKSHRWAQTRFFTAGIGNLLSHLRSHDGIDRHYGLQPRTVLLLRPFTGRTHQLRVAAKSEGLPIMGDPIYRDTMVHNNSTISYAHCDGNSSDTMITTRREAITISEQQCRTYLHATGLYIPPDEDQDTSWDGSLRVLCPPPFDHLWNEYGAQCFHQTLQRLMDTHGGI